MPRCDKCGVDIEYGQSAAGIAEKARADERERIVKMLHGMKDALRQDANLRRVAGSFSYECDHYVSNALLDVIHKIKSGCAHHKNPLVNLDESSFMTPDERALAGAYNVLADAVVELQQQVRSMRGDGR